MNRQFRALLFPTLAVLVMQAMAIAAPGARHTRDTANWNNLSKLVPGTEIKVVLTNRKPYRGKLQSLTDEAIVVELGHGEQRFERQNVFRVSTRGKSHRLRNTLLGAAVGAGAGLGFGAYIDGNPRSVFNLAFAGRNSGKQIFTPSFAVVGAVVGAALPARRWRDLYRVQ